VVAYWLHVMKPASLTVSRTGDVRN
jgi:hypothetical protein